MPSEYFYDDYIKKLSDRFRNALTEIEAEYAFEYGNEFEIALCQILRKTLPLNYGICRGFVVNRDGKKAGDDIIIYDQLRFPTIRTLSVDEMFLRKEKIPIEAVYAYIEAKHCLQLKDDENETTTLSRACKQAAAVKILCNEREEVSHGQISPHFKLPDENVKFPNGCPPIRNPMFTAVISRYVKFNKNSKMGEDSEKIAQIFKGNSDLDKAMGRNSGTLLPPDLIVAGPHYFCIPAIPRKDGEGSGYNTPFFISGRSQLLARHKKDIAFGVALISILFALDWIVLGRMPYENILGNALDMIDPS
jgi:hypothetical protein